MYELICVGVATPYAHFIDIDAWTIILTR